MMFAKLGYAAANIPGTYFLVDEPIPFAPKCCFPFCPFSSSSPNLTGPGKTDLREDLERVPQLLQRQEYGGSLGLSAAHGHWPHTLGGWSIEGRPTFPCIIMECLLGLLAG